jgi:hypothetical protein
MIKALSPLNTKVCYFWQCKPQTNNLSLHLHPGFMNHKPILMSIVVFNDLWTDFDWGFLKIVNIYKLCVPILNVNLYQLWILLLIILLTMFQLCVNRCYSPSIFFTYSIPSIALFVTTIHQPRLSMNHATMIKKTSTDPEWRWRERLLVCTVKSNKRWCLVGKVPQSWNN